LISTSRNINSVCILLKFPTVDKVIGIIRVYIYSPSQHSIGYFGSETAPIPVPLYYINNRLIRALHVTQSVHTKAPSALWLL